MIMSDIPLYEFEIDEGEGDHLVDFVTLDAFNDLQYEYKVKMNKAAEQQQQTILDLAEALDEASKYINFIYNGGKKKRADLADKYADLAAQHIKGKKENPISESLAEALSEPGC
jgi:hypothetical protein